MAVVVKIEIDGREVPFKASAATPRIYRQMFGRDIYRDLERLTEAIDSDNPLDTVSLEIFENLSYVMAQSADPEGVPDDINAWLDQFEIFSIYAILPKIIELWGLNSEMQVESKKNSVQRKGR